MIEEEFDDTPEELFDYDNMNLTDKIVNAIQLGNYLKITTDQGITFSQHIPKDKILSMNTKGDYVLLTMHVI